MRRRVLRTAEPVARVSEPPGSHASGRPRSSIPALRFLYAGATALCRWVAKCPVRREPRTTERAGTNGRLIHNSAMQGALGRSDRYDQRYRWPRPNALSGALSVAKSVDDQASHCATHGGARRWNAGVTDLSRRTHVRHRAPCPDLQVAAGDTIRVGSVSSSGCAAAERGRPSVRRPDLLSML